MLIKDKPVITDDDIHARYHFIPNPYTLGMGFDYGEGSCLMLYTDLQRYIKEHNVDEDCIWTVVDGDDGDLYLLHGFHYVNRVGYIVSKNPPLYPITEEIPFE